MLGTKPPRPLRRPAVARTARMHDSRMLKLGMVGLVAIAMGAAGCAARADIDTVAQDQQSMREMLANDRQQIDKLQEQVAQLNDRVTEMQHNGAEGGSKDTAALKDRVAKLESQVNATAAGTPLPAGAPSASGVPGAPSVPGASPQGAAPGTASASVAPEETEAPPPAAPAPVPSVPGWQAALDEELAAAGNSSEPGSRTYRDGLIDMKAGKYANAVGKFQAFQRAHPKSPLAEPAEYFSANALFEMGARDPSNYNQSILQFNDLAMRYPRGRFAASAQLREAQAFLRTNDSLDARLTLQKLVRDHPGTPEAAAADAMMKSMASS
jgi:TolA-binding protein